MGLLKRARPNVEAIEGRIRDAIAGLRPLLPVDATRIDLVNFESETGIAVLRVEGDCPDCEMSVAALLQGIEAHLKLRVPEIREIRPVSTVARNG